MTKNGHESLVVGGGQAERRPSKASLSSRELAATRGPGRAVDQGPTFL